MVDQERKQDLDRLSRRERQIMDVIFTRGSATVNDVLAALPDPPGYSSVRALLRILETKGHLRHKEDGPRYVFYPTVSPDDARKSAVRHLLTTFFDGSPEKAMAAILDVTEEPLTDESFDRLSRMIEEARAEEQ